AAAGWLSPEAAARWQSIGGRRLVVGRVAEPRTEGEALAETGSLLRDWMSGFGRAAAVVRPDKYVFGIATDPQQLSRMVGVISEAIGNEMSESSPLAGGSR